MQLIVKPYSALCELEKFIINGIHADYNDFGKKENVDPFNALQYGCGCIRFVSKLPTQHILDKYHINVDEYSMVCDVLTDKLSFRHCGWCI
jgi:hypothetical protein